MTSRDDTNLIKTFPVIPEGAIREPKKNKRSIFANRTEDREIDNCINSLVHTERRPPMTLGS